MQIWCYIIIINSINVEYYMKETEITVEVFDDIGKY